MSPKAVLLKIGLTPLSTDRPGKPQHDDKGFVDSGCSRHMTGNIAYLSDFKEFDGGYVAFRGGAYGGRISCKGTLKTDNLDFEDVYFVNELKFNLFSVSQMCDKKNYVLFTDTECLVLSPNFKLPDENQILLKIPRKDNMYSFDMKNIVPKESLTCLVAKATLDESMLWHRRLGHINFKNINKLVKDNLVRGLPTKRFENDPKPVGIKREYSVARTPQQNGVAERRNRTLIEATRTMLADSKLPTTFWAEAVITACYVHYRVLVVKPHNKTPYELFRGFKPSLSFMRPFGCHVTILNTLENLGKFNGKSNEGFFVGYSLSSKAFRVYNIRTRRVEENLHVGFLENKPMIEGNGLKWLFDIDSLTQSMNFVPVVAERGPRDKVNELMRVHELNGHGNDQGMGVNGGVEGVNRNVERANEGAPDFSMIITQQLQNLLPTMLAQVSNRGNVGNQNGNVVNENVQENVGNVIVNGNRVGCSYKEFLACNPKEYDGKEGVVVLTHWIEKMESVHDSDCCSNDQKVKYTTGSFVGKALTWWNSQIGTFHELARLVPHLVTPESRTIKRYVYGLAPQIRGMVAATEPKTIQKAMQISGALTDEAVRNGSIKKVKKRGNVREPSKDRSGKDDNKRTRTVNAFATTMNPIGRENMGTWPKCITCNSYYAPGGPCCIFFNCNRPGHLARDCRGVPRNVNLVNAKNLTVRACYECGSTDHYQGQGRGNQGNQDRGRAFMLGAEEARRDPNIVTGTFTLNNHFATTLFDSGADYSFVSTTFIPLLGLEPSNLGYKYEIEIASGQLVEIDKVIRGCKLEIEGHVFDIDLIPFGHGSFYVIIGMDWLSDNKAEIIFHEKLVRIPLPDGNLLRVLGERPEEKVRFFMGVKKQEENVVVRDFPEVFPDDLSGLPPIREIEFRIELAPGATSVVKSPYRLTPSELEELSGQLKELQD
ncbi:putative reverse transcriptase domain-containing protein, partial [Tanacetum coccineum]